MNSSFLLNTPLSCWNTNVISTSLPLPCHCGSILTHTPKCYLWSTVRRYGCPGWLVLTLQQQLCNWCNISICHMCPLQIFVAPERLDLRYTAGFRIHLDLLGFLFRTVLAGIRETGSQPQHAFPCFSPCLCLMVKLYCCKCSTQWAVSIPVFHGEVILLQIFQSAGSLPFMISEVQKPPQVCTIIKIKCFVAWIMANSSLLVAQYWHWHSCRLSWWLKYAITFSSPFCTCERIAPTPKALEYASSICERICENPACRDSVQ